MSICLKADVGQYCSYDNLLRLINSGYPRNSYITVNFDFRGVFDDLTDWEPGKSDFGVETERIALPIMAHLHKSQSTDSVVSSYTLTTERLVHYMLTG